MKKVLSDFQRATDDAVAGTEPQTSDAAGEPLLPGCRLQHWTAGRRSLLKIVLHRQFDPGR